MRIGARRLWWDDRLRVLPSGPDLWGRWHQPMWLVCLRAEDLLAAWGGVRVGFGSMQCGHGLRRMPRVHGVRGRNVCRLRVGDRRLVLVLADLRGWDTDAGCVV